MKLSIPCTWEETLLDQVCRLNDSGPLYPVFEFYGSLKAGWVGSGHSAASIGGECLHKKPVETFIKKIRERGFKFNYTINSTCLGNREFDYKYRKKILKELAWILSLSDSVTVTIPWLMEMVRETAGERVTIVASVIAAVDSLRKVEHFQRLGADRIVLSISLNRDLHTIKEIREKSRGNVTLELLVNDSCLYECPYRAYHYNTGSHGSTRDNLFYLDYCIFKCLLKRLQEPGEIIRSPWLRPEALEFYRDAVDIIKIGGREKTSAWVQRAVEAYAKGHYDGNILDLLTIVTPASHELGEYFLGKAPVFFLDNRELGPYFQTLLQKKHTRIDCSSCGLCETMAREHLLYDENEVQHYAGQLKKFGAGLFSSRAGLNRLKFICLKLLFTSFIKNNFLWRSAKKFLKNR